MRMFMSLNKYVTFFIALLLLSVTPFTKQAAADEQIENIVSTEIFIKIISATDLKINITMDVEKATAFGKTYNKNEINSLTTSTNRDDIEALGVIKNNLHLTLYEQIDKTFQNSEIKVLSDKPEYTDKLFIEGYTVNFTNAFFGLNESINTYEFINGLLNMGGVINYIFDLYSQPGWNTTYIFDLNTKYGLIRTNGKYDITKNTIQWEIRNWDGSKQNTTAELSMKEKNPSTTSDTKQDIFLEFLLDSESKVTTLQTNILIKKMDITNYSVIPDFITNLDAVTSDGLRLLVANNLTTWDEIYQKTIKPIQEKIKTTLETNKFNQTLDFVFNWDYNTTTNIKESYNIQHMDEQPPVKAILTDDEIKLKIYNIPVRGLFGLINSGAQASVTRKDINFGDKIENIGYPYNITLLMPKDITLNNQNRFTWNDTKNFTGEFQSKNPKTYNNEKIDTTIEINIKKTDLNLANIFTGKKELSFSLDISQKSSYNVTKIRDEFILPDEIKIRFLNSDTLRLCIEEGIFSEKMINSFLINEKNDFEEKLKTVIPDLKVKGNIDKQTFENSLKWDGNINQMEGKEPVITSYYSYTTHPVLFDISLIPPKFKIHNQTYVFKGIKNQSVTYRVIFPEGVTVDAYDKYNKTTVKETSDNRYCLEISFSPSEADLIINTTCILKPSMLFIIGVLMPCFITILIGLILLIMLVMIRRKKRRIKPAKKEEIPSDTGEEEYYYIPPPQNRR